MIGIDQEAENALDDAQNQEVVNETEKHATKRNPTKRTKMTVTRSKFISLFFYIREDKTAFNHSKLINK